MATGSAVLDASAVVRALQGQPDAAAWIDRAWAGGAELAAPELLLVEVANALRGYAAQGILSPGDAGAMLRDVVSGPIEPVPLRLVAGAALAVAIESGLSAYDACYVALAEGTGAVLVTADGKLAAATERAEQLA